MSFDPDPVETITFDSFTTIVDVHGSTTEALSRYLDDPAPVADVWRYRAVEYRMLSNFIDAYGTYYETTRDALEYALAVNGVDLDDDAVEDICSVFYDLYAFDDVRPAFERLVDAGYDLYIVSNGNQEVLDPMVENADIADLIEDCVSANEIRTYKPDVRFYEHVVDRIDTPAENTIHVATPWYDIYGANNAGMQSAWLNRRDLPWETFDGGPDLTVDTMPELADAFDA
jgi:2-haloacid dehalogenase